MLTPGDASAVQTNYVDLSAEPLAPPSVREGGASALVTGMKGVLFRPLTALTARHSRPWRVRGGGVLSSAGAAAGSSGLGPSQPAVMSLTLTLTLRSCVLLSCRLLAGVSVQSQQLATC